MNSWVNGGKPTSWLSQCNGNASAYLDLQEQYYHDVVKDHPSDSEYLSDWLGRTSRLRQYLKLK